MRLLFSAATALSALLALATAGLWVRSYWAFHDASYLAKSWCVATANARDGLALYRDAGRYTDRLGFHHQMNEPHTIEYVFGPPSGIWPLAVWSNPFSKTPATIVVIPYWLVVVAFAALPAYRLARRIRRRPRPGHCPSCGYDLRATPGRCPECGTIPAR